MTFADATAICGQDPKRIEDVPGIELELARFDVTDAAHDFNQLTLKATSIEDLALIKEAIDEGVGALLACEQILIRKREILQLERKR